MSKNLYIDASHPNETRVVLKKDDHIEDYEYESVNNTLIKNNIYLGKVSRVEPSLQAAFVDFGRERHGFLSFNDIQSDYWTCIKGSFKVGMATEEGGCDFVYLSDKDPRVIEMKPGVYHGYKALEPGSILLYYLTEKYNPDDEIRVPVGHFGEEWAAVNK